VEQMDSQVRDFVGYEYKELHSESSKVSFIMDGYECFGWKVDDNIYANNGSIFTSKIPMNSQKVTIRLKRERKIMNKAELTRLQRNFEAYVNEINELNKAKTAKATIWALIIGLIGTAFMAGSVFAATANPPQIVICILLAIPAFIGWIIPYFLYRKIVKIQTNKINPLIETKYDEIYKLCEKGNKLLHK